MNESLIFDKLIKRANELNNKALIDEIKSDDFIKSLDKISDVMNRLGLDLSNSSSLIDNAYSEINNKISSCLMSNYISLYYVDTKTGEYISYIPDSTFRSLKIDEKGTDFFGDVVKNIPSVIYEEDKED